MVKPIGLHVHSARARGMVEDYIRSVRPPVMKWMAGGLDSRLVDLAKVYGSLNILRHYEERQEFGNPHEERFFGKLESLMQRYPQFDAIEGYNEEFQRLPDIRRRSEFDIALMELCERYGKKAVIGSFSVGQPQWPETGHADDWAAYLPALRHAGEKGHYVGLHEYGAPALQWGVGANQAGNLVDGRWENIDPATRPGVKGWFILRYRRVVEHWKALGLDPLPKIVITESGIDDIQPRPNVGTRRGYKTYRDTIWWDPPVLGDYATQLAWMCDRWAEDDIIVGGVGFGFADISGDWDDFDLSTDRDTFNKVIASMQQLVEPDPVDPPPDPGPDPDPDPPPLPPPIDLPELARHYRPHVLQPGETLWRLAGSRWNEILSAKTISDPRDVQVGTLLLIPESED